MAKIYGGRWQIADANATIDKGGQAVVFRVIDTRGEHGGEYALKRILNPARHSRFQNEIEAIKRIKHPNVIQLIDHSALDDLNGDAQKQFLVMPIASGGNLRAASRISTYKGMIDGVVQVGKQLASGLAAAHAKGVIHRDVKPENILFTDVGHEVWLSDFGICLLREVTRNTDVGEVVGPRAFLAPELEYGGKLDVSPAADIYSLGKVLYYMISGGTILPREQLHEAQYSQIFSRGERHQLLQTLLHQMICPLEQRLKNMTEVAHRLEKIETWEKEAPLLPISSQGLARIRSLQRTAQENLRIDAENSAARLHESERLSSVQRGFESWLQLELEKVAAHIASSGILKAEVHPILKGAQPNWNQTIQTAPAQGYRAISGFEVRLRQPDDPSHCEHILEIRLCEELRISVSVYTGPYKPTAAPPKDQVLAMIPVYRRSSCPGTTTRIRVETEFGGFLAKRDVAGRLQGVLPRPGARSYSPNATRIESVTRSFRPGVSQEITFRASEWLLATDKLRIGLEEAIDSFIDFVADGARVIGN